MAERECRLRRALGKHRPIGSTDKCTVCGEEYTVTAGSQRYCPRCAPDAVADVDRRQGLEWYAQHKDVSNIIRNVKRRVGFVTCKMCGNEFESTGRPDRYCSDACRYEALRLSRAKTDAKRQGKPIPTTVQPPKKRASTLLHGVDWDKPVAQIAQETGLCEAAVYKYRKKEHMMEKSKKPVGRPTSDPTTQVYFRLPDAILSRVDAEAAANGLTRTQYLRMLVTRAHSGDESIKPVTR